jgi:hypothetical protein
MAKSHRLDEERRLMAKRKTSEPTEWIVGMLIERNITVVVEAHTEDEARAKAAEWDHIGDEQPGDTINWKITSVEPN